MAWFSQLFSTMWKHRSSLILIGRIAAEAWKTAKEVTREYIRFLVRKKLKRQIAIISLEIGILALAHAGVRAYPGLASRMGASLALWGVTLYNLFDLFWFTIPELRQVYRTLRGRIGYTLKYFLQVSVTNELLEWNILFWVFASFWPSAHALIWPRPLTTWPPGSRGLIYSWEICRPIPWKCL